MCYAAEKLLKDSGDKVEEADKNDINAKVAALKDAINSNNIEDMKAKGEELQKAMFSVSEKLYKANAPQGGAVPPQDGTVPPQGGADGNVYNAEYKEVDDDKKE